MSTTAIYYVCPDCGAKGQECITCIKRNKKGVCSTCNHSTLALNKCRICEEKVCPFCYNYEDVMCEPCVKKRRENEPKKERM